jgi:hypothetical protein
MAMASTSPSPRRDRGRRAGLRLVEGLGARLVGRRVFAVALLTLKAAVRYRLVQILIGLLLLAVLGLPLIIRHDGTAQGFTQILLTYTLGAITVLLGAATLWLACGTLARDIEECQMQMVVVKPIARWEVWLGKWLGIVILDTVLLGLAGVTVFVLMEWRAGRLPLPVQNELRQNILVARGSAREQVNQKLIDQEIERQLAERMKDPAVAGMQRNFVRQQITEQVKAQFQILPPGNGRRWRIHLGARGGELRSEPLFIRTKFYSPRGSAGGAPATYAGLWEVGPVDGRRARLEQPSLAAETFHEFPIPPGLIDDQGVLTVDFLNGNDTALLFPLDEGLEVLYREGGFGLNFVRGLGIIVCWMALLAAVGLAAASFLTFPVAAFLSLAILIVGFSTGTLKQVIEEGGVSGVNHDTGRIETPVLLDRVVVPAFRGLLEVINLVRGFSPVDALSTGRSVTWGQLARAVAQIVVLMGGLFAALGIFTFTRRELAAAQSG